tara:strand:+ start:2293 stop:2679 length:387 start_codon:yes stop_codon:yes gene_type:complete
MKKMNRIENIQKNWKDIRGRFNAPLFEKYLKARELSPDDGGPETIHQDTLDFHVGSADHFLGRIDVDKLIRDEVIIYQMKLDGQVIKELKCDSSGQRMSVTRFQVLKKSPYLWTEDMDIDSLCSPIKK